MATSSQWTAAFFRAHPVFRTEQFVAAAPSTTATAHTLLRAHRRSGRITNIRRGLWAAHEPGGDQVVDPYVVAGVVTADAIIGLHAAMELHGFGYSMHSIVTYYAARPVPPFECNGTRIRGVTHPHRLLEQDLATMETLTFDRIGAHVRATSVERALVDMLDRQDLSGGIEEVWRTTEQLGWLDDRRLLAYVRARRSTTLAARVGYLLEQHPQLQFPESGLAELRTMVTTGSPGPFELAPQARGASRYLHAWRLRVPQSVIDRTWEEPLS